MDSNGENYGCFAGAVPTARHPAACARHGTLPAGESPVHTPVRGTCQRKGKASSPGGVSVDRRETGCLLQAAVSVASPTDMFSGAGKVFLRRSWSMSLNRKRTYDEGTAMSCGVDSPLQPDSLV